MFNWMRYAPNTDMNSFGVCVSCNTSMASEETRALVRLFGRVTDRDVLAARVHFHLRDYLLPRGVRPNQVWTYSLKERFLLPTHEEEDTFLATWNFKLETGDFRVLYQHIETTVMK